MLRQTIFFLPFLFLACTKMDVKAEKDPNNFRFLETNISELSTGYAQGDFSIEEVTNAYFSPATFTQKHTSKYTKTNQYVITQV